MTSRELATTRELSMGRAIELRGQRVPFVSATVVRAERPTSAKAGDTAIVLSDGTIEGFVGGACAESSVRVQALECLAAGSSVLLRIVPDAESASPDPVGQTTVANPCLSGGTMEIFLEPIVPPPLVYVIGSSPIALALSRGAQLFGFDLRLLDTLPELLPDDTSAIVVASHGRAEEHALVAGLDAKVPYIGLVASHRRGSAVIESLGLADDQRSLIRSPAGLDIGAATPEEIALSILAQIVADRPRPPAIEHPPHEHNDHGTGVDPVCGMTVAAVPSSLQVEHNGETVYFCGPGCQQAFTADPERY